MISSKERELLEKLRDSLMERVAEDVSELHDEIVIMDREAEKIIYEAYLSALQANSSQADELICEIEFEENANGSYIVANVKKF